MDDATPEVLSHTIRLRDGVSLVQSKAGDSALMLLSHLEVLGQLTVSQKAFLRLLAVEQPVPKADHDLAGLAERLVAGGWVSTRVTWSTVPMFTARPRATRSAVTASAFPPRLSRLASIRRVDDAFVVESAMATSELTLHLTELVQVVADPLADGGVPPAVAEILHSHLQSDGFLATEAEVGDLALAQWSPHELAFHHGSRQRADHRIGADFGGTYWAKDTFDSLPARHPQWDGPSLQLPKPVATGPGPGALSVSLGAALETRRSVRAYDDANPVTVEQLGHLLHHAARVRATEESDGLQMSRRPYPSGGSIYELELYPLVRNVGGLASGLYHYDPFEHSLRVVPANAAAAHGLMAASAAGMTGDATPQVLLVVSARFGRLAWKYESIAYALTLKHVGALYQTLYLVATALGLAPCAIGVGDSDAFAEATGLDYFTEPSVGEFALGSLPASAGAP